MKSWPLSKLTNRSPRLLLSMGAALTVGVLGLYWAYDRSSWRPLTSPGVSRETNQPVSPPNIAAIGYLEPRGEVIEISASSQMEGRPRLERLLVVEGDMVKAGQVIAVLDNQTRLVAALGQARSREQIARARLQQVTAGAKAGDIQAQNAQLQKVRAELEGQIAVQKSTITSLEAQLKGEQGTQLATIAEIKAKLRNADKDCQRYRSLHQNGAVSIQERDRICLALETSRATLNAASANLERIKTTLQAQIRETKSNLARTVTTLNQQIIGEKEQLKAVSEVRLVDVNLARTELESARADIEKARADLALSYVKAPKNGQILKIHTWPGELIDEKGIVELGDTERMYVTAEVYETDVSRIRRGQSATIQSKGVAGDLQGTVAEIGLKIGRKDVLGTDPVADVDARVVEVKIRLNPLDSQRVSHLTNLQVNVLIDDSDSAKTNSPR